MRAKRAPKGFVGWILAEILCSVIIVSTIAACITESTSMITQISRWAQRRRVQSLDFWSLANEIAHSDTSGDIRRGVWTAKIVGFTHKNGMKFSDVSFVAEDSVISGRGDLRWKSWKIAGRRR
jgi:hypothetical protein